MRDSIDNILLLGLMLLAISLFLSMGCTPNQDTPDTNIKYTDYYYVGERVPFAQCKQAIQFADGCVGLSECTSGREYYCLTNVYTIKNTEHTKPKQEKEPKVFAHWLRR